MRFNKALRLDVYVHTEEELALKELDVDTSFDVDGDTDPMFFFSVEHVGASKEGPTVSLLFSGSEAYYIKCPTKELIHRIEQHKSNCTL